MVRDGLLCFVCPKRFSLSGSQAWIGASLDVDQFPSASLTTRQVFLWLLPRAAYVDGRAFQSDFLWHGPDHQRTEPSSPSLLEASLKVKRNNAHGWSSRSESSQHSRQRVSMA